MNLTTYFKTVAKSHVISQIIILIALLFALKVCREAVLRSERVISFDRDLQNGNPIARVAVVKEGVLEQGMAKPISYDDVLNGNLDFQNRSTHGDLIRLQKAEVPWHMLDVKYYPWLSYGEVVWLAISSRLDDVPVGYAVLLLVASLRLYSAVPAVTEQSRGRHRGRSHYLWVVALSVLLGFGPQLQHVWDNGPLHGTFWTHWFIPLVTVLSRIDGVLYIYLGVLAAFFVMDYWDISRRCLEALKGGEPAADRVSTAVFCWVPVAIVIFAAFLGVTVVEGLASVPPLRYSGKHLLYSLLVLLPPALVCVSLIRRYWEYVSLRYDRYTLSPTLVRNPESPRPEGDGWGE